MPDRPPMPPGAAIQVHHLGKKYRIGALQTGDKTLSEVLTDTLKRPVRIARTLRRGKRALDSERDVIWALRNITFDVARGDVVGIIGRNGAGKSTLLKVLTRITTPDAGFARIRGRVGSLLEVGTGFHGELTGRENIYLNGAILGMHRHEIDAKFDEIIAFSGVERFIDTPVKRYSSGMYLRLAFSVAAHLEPDILLVDEVLAVGDAEFQKKCLGKMSDVAGEGRTVLFVSHNMASVQALCNRAILLQQGQIIADGGVGEIVDRYLQSVRMTVEDVSLGDRTDRKGSDALRFTHVEFLHSETGYPLPVVISGQPVVIRLHYHASTDVSSVMASLAFRTSTGSFLFATRSDAVGKTFDIAPGDGVLECVIPRWPLSAGLYSYNVIARQHGTTLDWVQEAGYITTEAGDYYGTGILPGAVYQGVFIDFDWKDRA